MPESQDDDDTGYFPLVMTRKSKAQQSIASDAQALPNNGVNGSWIEIRYFVRHWKSFSFSVCALFHFMDNEKVGKWGGKFCGGTGWGDDEMCSCGLVLSCYDKVYNQSGCVCSVEWNSEILFPPSQFAHYLYICRPFFDRSEPTSLYNFHPYRRYASFPGILGLKNLFQTCVLSRQ